MKIIVSCSDRPSFNTAGYECLILKSFCVMVCFHYIYLLAGHRNYFATSHNCICKYSSEIRSETENSTRLCDKITDHTLTDKKELGVMEQ